MRDWLAAMVAVACSGRCHGRIEFGGQCTNSGAIAVRCGKARRIDLAGNLFRQFLVNEVLDSAVPVFLVACFQMGARITAFGIKLDEGIQQVSIGYGAVRSSVPSQANGCLTGRRIFQGVISGLKARLSSFLLAMGDFVKTSHSALKKLSAIVRRHGLEANPVWQGLLAFVRAKVLASIPGIDQAKHPPSAGGRFASDMISVPRSFQSCRARHRQRYLRCYRVLRAPTLFTYHKHYGIHRRVRIEPSKRDPTDKI